jgi:uncharacterized protein (TIGR03435 family)
MQPMRPILLLLAVSAFAQTPPAPAFDVATVKLNPQYQSDNADTWSTKVAISPGALTMRNVNMYTLLEFAYHVQKFQIVLPAGFEFHNRAGDRLLDSIRYDVLAKCDRSASEDEMRPMLQTLLAERFHLAMHRETRTISVFALVETKGGHKMRPSQLTKADEATPDQKGLSQARGVSMSEIAKELADARDFNSPVIDATGLKGRYDFEVNFRAHIPQMKPGDPPPDVLSIIQETLQQDLGLKLESRKVPIEVLVIDRLDKTPAEN